MPMRHAEWKKLQVHPVVLKAQEALKMAQEEMSKDPFWKGKVTHLGIFPDAAHRNALQLLVTDFAFLPLGQLPMTRREIAWDAMANASSDEAKAMLIAEIRKFDPAQR